VPILRVELLLDEAAAVRRDGASSSRDARTNEPRRLLARVSCVRTNLKSYTRVSSMLLRNIDERERWFATCVLRRASAQRSCATTQIATATIGAELAPRSEACVRWRSIRRRRYS